MVLIKFTKRKSKKPRKAATANEKPMTTKTIFTDSRRLGQFTRRISVKASLKNFLARTVLYLKLDFLPSNVKIFDRSGVDLDEAFSRFDFAPHQNIEHPIGFFGVFDGYDF